MTTDDLAREPMTPEDGGPQVAPTWIWERRVAALQAENKRLRDTLEHIAWDADSDPPCHHPSIAREALGEER